MQWLNYIDHWVADGNSLHFLLADQRTGIFEIVSEIPVFLKANIIYLLDVCGQC